MFAECVCVLDGIVFFLFFNPEAAIAAAEPYNGAERKLSRKTKFYYNRLPTDMFMCMTISRHFARQSETGVLFRSISGERVLLLLLLSWFFSSTDLFSHLLTRGYFTIPALLVCRFPAGNTHI